MTVVKIETFAVNILIL